ncbi:hypothetical protein JMG10_03390 [Nostoc ellipsosporum NOK]|nr:hypothetical protein [Nostoc ellipsosporum NOK]
MNEMRYEFLIRKAYDSERDYDLGADADIYREMESAFHDLDTKVMFATQSDRDYEFRKKFTRVCQYVKKALLELSKRHRLPTDLQELLKNMAEELSLNFYDKVRLDEIIDNALSMVREEEGRA